MASNVSKLSLVLNFVLKFLAVEITLSALNKIFSMFNLSLVLLRSKKSRLSPDRYYFPLYYHQDE